MGRIELYNLKDDIGDEEPCSIESQEAKKMKTQLTSRAQSPQCDHPLAVPPKASRLNEKR